MFQQKNYRNKSYKETTRKMAQYEISNHINSTMPSKKLYARVNKRTQTQKRTQYSNFHLVNCTHLLHIRKCIAWKNMPIRGKVWHFKESGTLVKKKERGRKEVYSWDGAFLQCSWWHALAIHSKRNWQKEFKVEWKRGWDECRTVFKDRTPTNFAVANLEGSKWSAFEVWV